MILPGRGQLFPQFADGPGYFAQAGFRLGLVDVLAGRGRAGKSERQRQAGGGQAG